jgi:hypothetical protein
MLTEAGAFVYVNYFSGFVCHFFHHKGTKTPGFALGYAEASKDTKKNKRVQIQLGGVIRLRRIKPRPTICAIYHLLSASMAKFQQKIRFVKKNKRRWLNFRGVSRGKSAGSEWRIADS